MNGGPSGFHNAPVTRNFVIGSALLTIVLGVQARSPRLGLSYQDIFEEFRLWRFPKMVASFFSRLSWPSLGSSPRTMARGNIMRNVPTYAGRQMQGNYPSAPIHAAMPEPPESSIATLVSMGFDSNSARRALMQARNDINAATNILLEAQSR